jgi:aspartyl-tRNA(Asn)/glutamyl-tRNA(Gln) amidotransferase subunit C
MKIDDALIDRLAKLSSLQIADDKKENLKSELADIVSFVENLNEVDVSHVEATFTTIAGGTRLREDESNHKKELSDDIMKHAPKVEDNYFIVPAIIE